MWILGLKGLMATEGFMRLKKIRSSQTDKKTNSSDLFSFQIKVKKYQENIHTKA